MYRDQRVLAVITARGGSKGVPRKNVLPLAGKPLIAWTIDAAKNARHLARVVLSSDDQEIIDAARKYECDVPFVRPAELSGDLSRQSEVMIHAVDALRVQGEKPFDAVLCLQPTTPFRSAAHIDEAIERFIQVVPAA